METSHDPAGVAKVPSHLKKVVVLFGGVGTAPHTVDDITGRSALVAILGTHVPVVFLSSPVPSPARLVPLSATTVKAPEPVASPVCVAFVTLAVLRAIAVSIVSILSRTAFLDGAIVVTQSQVVAL